MPPFPLKDKTDARSAKTTFNYDALRRPTSKTYTGVSTPSVTYTYGTTLSNVNYGQLTNVSNSVSATAYTYDSLGRVVSSTQTTAGTAYPFTYQYELNGSLKQVGYPSGRTATFTSREYTGQPLTAAWGSTTLASTPTYAAHGALEEVKFGNNRWEYRDFNPMLQTGEIGLGTSQGMADLLKLVYTYGGTNNNGNVQTQTIFETGQTHEQHYSYDGINRLTMASEGAVTAENCPGGAAWCRKFDYDAFGNRALVEAPGVMAMPGIANFSAATNRLTTAGYDFAGNMIQDPTGRQISYDVEGRVAAFVDPNMASKNRTYGYDGEGRRVRKTSGTASTIYVYDAFGRLAAEYEPTAPTGPGGRYYRTADTLGSTRLITEATVPNPAVLARYDYTPFGERIPAGVGGRPSVYGDDGWFGQQFTGQYRDEESKLDYFNARYLASAIGRFLSPDLPFLDQNASDPQSWNLYAYVRNNPLVYIDPSGLTCQPLDSDDPKAGYYDDGDGLGCEAAGVLPDEAGGLENSGQKFEFDFGEGPEVEARAVTNVLSNFLSGNGPREIVYGSTSPFTRAFLRSIGAKAIEAKVAAAGCPESGVVSVPTGEAFVNALIDGIAGGEGFYTPHAQMGAFDALFSRQGNTVSVAVSNQITMNSALLHVPNKLGIDNPSAGPLGTIQQTLRFSIPNPCGQQE